MLFYEVHDFVLPVQFDAATSLKFLLNSTLLLYWLSLNLHDKIDKFDYKIIRVDKFNFITKNVVKTHDL